MEIKTLDDLFASEIFDMYDAERQLTEAMPKMAEAASDKELKRVFEDHLEETRGQLKRLAQVLEICGLKYQGEECEATQGLVEEAEEMIERTEKGHVRDAALICCAQKVEHYEIATYGTMIAIAQKLGHDEAVKLLKETIQQEKSADQILNKLALSEVNEDACREAA